MQIIIIPLNLWRLKPSEVRDEKQSLGFKPRSQSLRARTMRSICHGLHHHMNTVGIFVPMKRCKQFGTPWHARKSGQSQVQHEEFAIDFHQLTSKIDVIVCIVQLRKWMLKFQYWLTISAIIGIGHVVFCAFNPIAILLLRLLGLC